MPEIQDPGRPSYRAMAEMPTTPTSRPTTLEDDDQSDEYELSHIKYHPDRTYTEGKRCNFCGDTKNWDWVGVVQKKGGYTIKKIGKVLLCMKCLVDGGWLSNEVLNWDRSGRRRQADVEATDVNNPPDPAT